jgi:hypothetical protein
LKTEKSPKLEIQGNHENMNLTGPVHIAILSSDYFKSLTYALANSLASD